MPLAERVVEVIADLGPDANPRDRFRYGSGCRVAGRTVLTAAHVVAGAHTVVVRGPDKLEQPAELDPAFLGDPEGPAPDRAPDLALLLVPDRPAVAALPLAAVDRDSAGGEPVERCQAVGYPEFAERPGSGGSVRDTVHTDGHIPVLSHLVSGLLTLQVTSSPRDLPPAEEPLGASPWSGMSGAPVLADGHLVGVVTEHAPRAGPSAITVIPLTALDHDSAHPGWGSGVANPLAWWARLGAPDNDGSTLPRLPRHRPEAPDRAAIREIQPRAERLVGRRRRRAGFPVTAEQVDQAAATLAGLVREQWQEEAKVRSLGDPEPMPVRWRVISTSLMDDPTVIVPDGSLAFAGRSDRIGSLAEAFRALPRQRLVITGGPGTGKTTLAVQLLLELLPSPGDAPTGPVPVLFSLASWLPDAQPRIQDWLTEQLAGIYTALRAIGPDVAGALVAQGRVLPVLDGLDEVSPVRRAGIIAALNASLDPDGGLILTSRRAEYRGALAAAEDVLTAAAVIGPLALTPAEAATFLRKHIPSARHADWDDVLDALTSGSAPNLAEVVSTPLGLWLVRIVYIDGRLDPAGLVDATYPTRAELRSHLLAELIPAVIRSRPPLPRRHRGAPEAPLRPARQHRPEDLRAWLTALAHQLAATPTRPRAADWLWWELAQHTFPTWRSRLAFRATAGLPYGLLLGLVTALALDRPEAGPALGLTAGLAAGLIAEFGLMAEPRHANFRLSGRIPELRTQFQRHHQTGLWAGGMLGLAAAGWPTADLGRALIGAASGALIGQLAAMAGGFVGFVRSADVAERAASPTRSYRGDRLQSMLLFLLSVTVSLAVGLVAGLRDGLQSGLAIGLLMLLFSGLLAGLTQASFTFLTAALWQALSRRLPVPWRTMSVLQDAHRLGLLRTVGPAYQFRHAELQDHLAPPSPGAATMNSPLLGRRGRETRAYPAR